VPDPLDYLPTASLARLQQRGELLWAIRQWFSEAGFLEVQTPSLSADTVVDLHLDPPRLATAELQLNRADLPATLFLQTSPEYAMKRLLVAGMEAIYQIGPAFRAGERGPQHNPEFTMLEWYRVGNTASDAIDFLERFANTFLPGGRCRRQTYRELFAEAVGWDPLEISTEDLQRHVAGTDAALAASLRHDRDSLLDWVLATQIQPLTAPGPPLIVTHYPLSQAALAQASSAHPGTAERFELFAGGLELANGYGELLDPEILRQRAAKNQQQRDRQGKPPLPGASRLLTAMQAGLPPCAGVALGIDRLLMVAGGCETIEEVLPFPIERA
jgi:lysyl-tRNA synthetase class 2